MPTVQRLEQRAAARARKTLASLADEFRQKRLAIGLSQFQVATAAGIGRPTYTRIEGARFASLSILVATRIAAVLGLDLSVRAYP
ncbi:MAG TPA: helix-turn-helix transcriptional regulator, partial [Acidimicrobiales bacterium]|nr:helix-turn-helix transcriptional regulator [Acidimicrobiales bacterium]